MTVILCNTTMGGKPCGLPATYKQAFKRSCRCAGDLGPGIGEVSVCQLHAEYWANCDPMSIFCHKCGTYGVYYTEPVPLVKA